MSSEPGSEVSNVLLVTVDSLRADAIGAYDQTRHTPVLDRLADRGTVFERAFANGNWTPFSFPSLLASRPVFADNGRIGVTESETLGSTLSADDVATAGFNAANGFLSSHWGYGEGFEEFDSFVANVGSGLYEQYLATHPTVEAWVQFVTSPVRRLRSRLRGKSDSRPFLDASRMFDVEEAATSFIHEQDEPFFLWVHYMDTHTPYMPAPRYIREVSDDRVGTHRMLHAHARTGLGWEVGERTLADLRTLYQAATRQADASIGRLLDGLSAAGVADETAVIVAGDHGEEFQEHGHLAHYPKLYDELIQVPLIVDVPRGDGRRVETQVGLDAIPPTVASLLDKQSPAAWQGESLVPTVYGEQTPDGEPVVSVAVRGEKVTTQPIPRSLSDGDLLVSVRDRDWTYIENTAGNGSGDDIELYHRPTDPGQQTDRSVEPGARAQKKIEEFSALAAEHATRLRGQAEGDAEEAERSEALDARLEALGYK